MIIEGVQHSVYGSDPIVITLRKGVDNIKLKGDVVVGRGIAIACECCYRPQ